MLVNVNQEWEVLTVISVWMATLVSRTKVVGPARAIQTVLFPMYVIKTPVVVRVGPTLRGASVTHVLMATMTYRPAVLSVAAIQMEQSTVTFHVSKTVDSVCAK